MIYGYILIIINNNKLIITKFTEKESKKNIQNLTKYINFSYFSFSKLICDFVRI